MNNEELLSDSLNEKSSIIYNGIYYTFKLFFYTPIILGTSFIIAIAYDYITYDNKKYDNNKKKF